MSKPTMTGDRLAVPSPCRCNQRLPWHLIGLYDGRGTYAHNCGCGRKWTAESPTTVSCDVAPPKGKRAAKAQESAVRPAQRKPTPVTKATRDAWRRSLDGAEKLAAHGKQALALLDALDAADEREKGHRALLNTFLDNMVGVVDLDGSSPADVPRYKLWVMGRMMRDVIA